MSINKNMLAPAVKEDKEELNAQSNQSKKNNALPDDEHAQLLSRKNSHAIGEESASERLEDYQMLLNNSQGSIYDPNAIKQNDHHEGEQQQQIPKTIWQKFMVIFRNHQQKCRERREKKKQEIIQLSQKSNVSLLVRLSVQSSLAILMWRIKKTYIERKKLAQRDLNLAQKMKEELEKDGFCYLNPAAEGQRLILKGRIDPKAAQNASKNKSWNITVKDEKSSRQIVVQTEQDHFQDSAPVVPLQSSKNILTSAIASTAYFLSSNFLKFKLKTDNKLSLSNSFYFLGIKTHTKDLLKVSNIMKSLDILRHKIDKKVMIACAIGCTLACAFFAVKSAKTVHALIHKNKEQMEKTAKNILEQI